MNDDSADLLTATRRLRQCVAELALPLEATGAAAARIDAAALIRQLDDHVLPRIEHLDAPALVVVGGSTGSGKSLVVNSLVGADVSRSGVLRPTTRSPVLIHHPDDTQWFSHTIILRGLARTTGPEQFGDDVHRELRPSSDRRESGGQASTEAERRSAAPELRPSSDRRESGGQASTEAERRSAAPELRLVASTAVPEGVALLDAPDIDSIDAANRELAAQLLAAADVWVFVTTAARYADAVPWDFLHQSRDRGTPLVLLLNRVPPGAMSTIEGHLRALLEEHRLLDVTLFGIDEQPLADTRLPSATVAPLQAWLDRLGSDRDARSAMVRRSLHGSLVEMLDRSAAIADAADHQATVTAGLRQIADRHYQQAQSDVRDAVNDGQVLRGEVLSRWEEFVGTGELLRQLRTGIGRLRDRVTGALTGRARTTEQLSGAVEGVVEGLVRNHADAAAAATLAEWRAHPAASMLLDRAGGIEALHIGLGRSSPELAERTAHLVRNWQGSLLELIRSQGAHRRSTARFLSFGVNGVSMVLMVLVFSHTGGLTGGEVAIAGGTSAVGHALLESLLGDDNLRRLAAQARTDLDHRIGALYALEQQRFTGVIDHLGVHAEGGAPLRAAIGATRRELK